MKTNKTLKIQLENILSDITPNVFLESAEDDSIYPYVVYNLKEASKNEDSEVYFLDVDIWDKNDTTVNVDDLASKLKKLNKLSYIDDNIQFSLYYDRTLNPKSESKEWKRYVVIFELRVLERS